MRLSKALAIFILLFSLACILLAGCSKPGCKTSADCALDNSCVTAQCSNNRTCVYALKADCCGNKICEKDANEEQCNCSTDCGKCEGKAKYSVPLGYGNKTKQVDYTYAIYEGCVQGSCKIGIDPNSVDTLRLTNNINEISAFKAETLTVLNNPFDISKDKVAVTVQLKDLSPSVMGGIIFTRIRLLYGSEVMGTKAIDRRIDVVGNSFTEELSLTSSQKLVEEERNLDINVDYQYSVKDSGETKTKRSSPKSRLYDKLMFITTQ
jgi:hypothetical protein